MISPNELCRLGRYFYCYQSSLKSLSINVWYVENRIGTLQTSNRLIQSTKKAVNSIGLKWNCTDQSYSWTLDNN